MLALVVAVVVAAAVVGLGSLLMGRPRHPDEVARFHRAASLTSEWARGGAVGPFPREDARVPEPSAEPIDLREPADIS